MIEFSFDKYTIAVHLDTPPDVYGMWLEYAKYLDTDDLSKEGTSVYIGIAQGGRWYEDIIAFNTDPVDYGGFYPGFLIIPETEILFIGAGIIIKTYDLKNHKKVFQKDTFVGFWGWQRWAEYVIMLEELEFGVYDLKGNEIWSTYVEPPWTYEINEGIVTLNVMDKLSYRNIITGELINKSSLLTLKLTQSESPQRLKTYSSVSLSSVQISYSRIQASPGRP